MSYILEALRRSQAERERGQVPGLGTQALPVAAPEPAPRRWPAWALAGVLGLGAVALLVLWLLLSRPAEALKPTDAAAGAAVAPGATGAPVAASVAASVSASVATALASPAVPSPSTPASSPPTALVVVSAPVAPPPLASAPAASAAAPDSPAAIPLAQLSPEQRREWPAFSLGGTVWSENPASRFVIANGQVVHEGEAIAPGLVLERIAPRNLRLRWRGLLVDMPH